MTLTPTERILRARLGTHSLHATVDSRKHTELVRRAFMARFDDEVDLDRTLPDRERSPSAEARRADFTRAALKAAQAWGPV